MTDNRSPGDREAGRAVTCSDRFVDPLRVGPETLADGGGQGALAGVGVAVKDIIDVAGLATGVGNPDFLAAATPAVRHADAVARLLEAGARVIGKAHTDEFAFSLAGTNAHYGTPRNPAAPGRVPGGSSSGSAAAVAAGVVALAIGSDTAGSIRVPASYCGVWGLRPSHGRVPMTGIWPLAPSFDTCGPLAADGELLERAGLAMLGGAPAREHPRELVLAGDLLAEADPGVADAVADGARRLASALGARLTHADIGRDRLTDWLQAFRGRQLVEAWRSSGAWLTAHRPSLGPGVASRFAAARVAPERGAEPATAAGIAVRAALDAVLAPGAALVLPSAATVAPPPALGDAAREDLRSRTLRLTCLAGLAGAPAVSLPLASDGGLPVGVCLLARVGEDERLLAAARVASALARVAEGSRAAEPG